MAQTFTAQFVCIRHIRRHRLRERWGEIVIAVQHLFANGEYVDTYSEFPRPTDAYLLGPIAPATWLGWDVDDDGRVVGLRRVEPPSNWRELVERGLPRTTGENEVGAVMQMFCRAKVI